MKIKTSELTGAALDWAVAVAEGHVVRIDDLQYEQFQYSMLWSQGGPIIEREYININHPNGSDGNNSDWIATWKFGGYEEFRGSTPLIAAMRCYVASRLGEEVDIPEELS